MRTQCINFNPSLPLLRSYIQAKHPFFEQMIESVIVGRSETEYGDVSLRAGKPIVLLSPSEGGSLGASFVRLIDYTATEDGGE